MDKNNEEESKGPHPSDRAKSSEEDNDTSSEMTALFVFEPHIEETLPQQLDITHARNLFPSSWYSGSRHTDNSAPPVDNNKNDSEGGAPTRAKAHPLTVPEAGPSRTGVSAPKHDPHAKREETLAAAEQENTRSQGTQTETGPDPTDFQSTRAVAVRQHIPIERLFLNDQKEQEIEEWLDEQPNWPR